MTLNYGNSRKRRLVLARARQQYAEPPRPSARLTQTRIETNPRDALRFLHDCHAPLDAVLTVAATDQTPGLRFRLDRPNWLIGSDASCDLVLPHQDVLPVQGILQWVAGSLARIHWAPVANGYELRIHWWKPRTTWTLPGFQLHWNAETPASPPMDSPHSLVEDPDGPGSLELVVTDPTGKESPRFNVDRSINLVGRFSGCDIRLNNRSVQPLQAALVLHGTSCWAVDLTGRGIATANGSHSYLSLDPGDQFAVAGFDCELRRSQEFDLPHPAPRTGNSQSLPSTTASKPSVDPMQILADFARQQAEVLGGMQQILSRLQQPGQSAIEADQLDTLRTELDRFSKMGRQQIAQATDAIQQRRDAPPA